MIFELLSTIQFVCLIVSGLMTAAVILFVAWQSTLRRANMARSFFGVESIRPAGTKNVVPVFRGGADPQEARPVAAAPGECAVAATFYVIGEPANVSIDLINDILGARCEAAAIDGPDGFPDAGRVPPDSRVKSTGSASILVFRQTGERGLSGRWLLKHALPKLKAKNYQTITAPDCAAAIGVL